MIASEIIDTCRRDILDDPNDPHLWDDAFCLSALNRGQREACNRQDLIFDATTATYGTTDAPLCRIPLVVGQQSYHLDVHWNQIENLIVAGVPLIKRSMEEMEGAWRTATGPVCEYVQRLYTVYLVAIPANDLAGQYLYVEGYRMPLTVVDDMDVEMEIPPEFQDHLKWWVAHEAYNKRDAETYNPQRSLECKAEFERIFGPPVPAGVRMHQFNEPRIGRPRPVDYLPPRRPAHWTKLDERTW